MGSFPMCVENSFCLKPLPKYLASKTVLIYCPHPVLGMAEAYGCGIAVDVSRGCFWYCVVCWNGLDNTEMVETDGCGIWLK
jgi:hypothetical protein